MGEELTIHEAAADPLIGQVLKADGVPQAAFAQLLQSAARVRANELERAITGDKPRVQLSNSIKTDRDAVDERKDGGNA